jgi:hypothetical protein
MENLIRQEIATLQSRRWFLRNCGVGMAGLALNQLFSSQGVAATSGNPLAARSPHFAPTAKRVIYIFQAGAPSHLDLFDHKPELVKRDGELPPAALAPPLGGPSFSSGVVPRCVMVSDYCAHVMSLSQTIARTVALGSCAV